MKSKSDEVFSLDVVSVRLVKDSPIFSERPINNPSDLVELLGEYMCELDREVICVVNLRNDGIPINCHFASVGAVNHAIAHPRELFKASILSNASHMMLIHNHPSGKLQPSEDDTRLTDRMVNLCQHMGIPLLDHVIVGGKNQEYFSFCQKKILPTAHVTYESNYEMINFPMPMAAERGRSR